MTQKKVDLERELVECNARLAECNRRLAENRGKKEDDVNLLKEIRCRFYRDTMTIGGVMIAFGAGILGYFGDNVTIGDTMAVGGIGVIGYNVGLFMTKIA